MPDPKRFGVIREDLEYLKRAWLKTAAPFFVSTHPLAGVVGSLRLDRKIWCVADTLLTGFALLLGFVIFAQGTAEPDSAVLHIIGMTSFLWPIWVQLRFSGILWKSGAPSLRTDLALTTTSAREALTVLLKEPLLRAFLPLLCLLGWFELTIIREAVEHALLPQDHLSLRHLIWMQGHAVGFLLPGLVTLAGLGHLVSARTRRRSRVAFMLLQVLWAAAAIGALMLVPALYSNSYEWFRLSSSGLFQLLPAILSVLLIGEFLLRALLDVQLRTRPALDIRSSIQTLLSSILTAVVVPLSLTMSS